MHCVAEMYAVGKVGSPINVKMFQQDDTFCTVFYFLQTALQVSHSRMRLIHDDGRSHTVCHYQML
jgi:hypothetical protein